MRALILIGALTMLVACGGGGEQGNYVASRNRDKFHRPSCQWAQKISEANRVWYATRDDAIKDGKRPCKVCRP